MENVSSFTPCFSHMFQRPAQQLFELTVQFLLHWCCRNSGLDVDSGERRVISSVVLEADDLDLPPDQVYYFLNAAPRFGKLQLKVTKLTIDPVFCIQLVF